MGFIVSGLTALGFRVGVASFVFAIHGFRFGVLGPRCF